MRSNVCVLYLCPHQHPSNFALSSGVAESLASALRQAVVMSCLVCGAEMRRVGRHEIVAAHEDQQDIELAPVDVEKTQPLTLEVGE